MVARSIKAFAIAETNGVPTDSATAVLDAPASESEPAPRTRLDQFDEVVELQRRLDTLRTEEREIEAKLLQTERANSADARRREILRLAGQDVPEPVVGQSLTELRARAEKLAVARRIVEQQLGVAVGRASDEVAANLRPEHTRLCRVVAERLEDLAAAIADEQSFHESAMVRQGFQDRLFPLWRVLTCRYTRLAASTHERAAELVRERLAAMSY